MNSSFSTGGPYHGKTPRFPPKTPRHPKNSKKTLRRGKGGLGLGKGSLGYIGNGSASGVVNGSAGVVNGSAGLGNGSAGVVNGSAGVVNGSAGVVNGSAGVVNGSAGQGKGAFLISNNSNSSNANNKTKPTKTISELISELNAEDILPVIIYSIIKNNNELLSLTLENYPDYVDITDDNGDTPLFYAVGSNNKDALNILLMKGADMNHINNQGETALHSAAYKNNLEMINELLELGANTTVESDFGEKPINVAASQGYARLIPKFPRLPMPADLHLRVAISDENLRQHLPAGMFESVSTSVFYAAQDVIANHNLCVGIGRAFMEGSYENANFLIMLMDAEDIVLGAASLLVDFDNNWFEIDLFCTDYRYKGIGSHLMDIIKRLKTYWGKKIRLKSVNDAHNFYIKQGFINNAGPKVNGLTPMTYS